MGLQQGNGVSGNAVPGNTLGNTGSGNTGLGSIGSGDTATGSSAASGNRSMMPAQANLPPARYPSSRRVCGAAGIVAIVCIAVGGVIAALGTLYYGKVASDMSAAVDGTYDGVPAETLSVLLFSPFVGLIMALVMFLNRVADGRLYHSHSASYTLACARRPTSMVVPSRIGIRGRLGGIPMAYRHIPAFPAE